MIYYHSFMNIFIDVKYTKILSALHSLFTFAI